MVGNVTNCARIREQMLDAASAALSGGVRAAFDAHVLDCAVCREEFRRVQTLAQKIDRTLSVSLAAGPSAQLVANVRRDILQDINMQPHRAETWMRWSKWATAAGVCAAFASLLFVARTSRKFNRPIHDSAAVHTSGSSTSKIAAGPRVNADTEVAVTQPRKPPLVRRASLRAPHGIASEPEIIVNREQMQAILRFAAAHGDDVGGAKSVSDSTIATDPIEIKPLKIVSLASASNPSNPPPSDIGQDGERNAKGELR